MGYYTNFDISVLDDKITEDILESLTNITEYEFDRTRYGVHICASWGNFEKDMCELSRLYPNKIFIVDGEGEENDDVWKMYWKNGKFQESNRTVIYEPFDEKELREWN